MDKEDTRYMQDNEPEFLVEIAYALPHQQLIVPVRAYTGMTAEQAIQASGILMKFPEIDLSVNKIGLFWQAIKIGYAITSFRSRRNLPAVDCRPKRGA